jgi:UDP-2,3-diacylglucosamine pyrophosphatase LpxH
MSDPPREEKRSVGVGQIERTEQESVVAEEITGMIEGHHHHDQTAQNVYIFETRACRL